MAFRFVDASRSWWLGLVAVAGAVVGAEPIAREASPDPQPTAVRSGPRVDRVEPTAEQIAVEAAAVFEKLDVAPRDGILAGRETETVVGYDADADGRVTPEEFVRGYLVKKPTAAWRRHEFKREGFACEMPGMPEPLDSGGAAAFQVAVQAKEPEVLLVARMRDMPARAAGKPDVFFDTLVEQLEASGATVVGRQKSDLGLHRGSVIAAQRQDGTLEAVRSVAVGRTVYELHALLPKDRDAAAKETVDRFFRSLEIIR